MMLSGVLAGITSAFHGLSSYPLSTVLIGGTFGRTSTGSLVDTPSAINWPDLMNGRMGPRLSMVKPTRPATRSVTDCDVPLYGTAVVSNPAISANSAPDRWLVVPIPAVAYWIAP